MKLFYTIALLLTFYNYCLGDVWEGDYTIYSQRGANNFGRKCKCTTINGDLLIQGSTIHIDSLHHLEAVNGTIYIFYTENLESIEGLNNLKSIGKELSISNNAALERINGFEHLISVGERINISANALKIINGFNKLTNVKSIEISNKGTLNEIIGFNSIDSLPDLKISSGINKFEAFNSLKKVTSGLGYRSDFTNEFLAFDKLQEVSGRFDLNANLTVKQLSAFDNLQTVRYFFIKNSSIEELNAFNNLTSVNTLGVYGCQSLKKIGGFINLKQIDLLEIYGNPQLMTILPFDKLFHLDVIYVSGNTNLKSLDAFSNLKSAHYITVKGNNNLLELTTFNQVSHVDNIYIESRNLRNLNAFRNLKTIGKLTLFDNIQLRSMDNFTQLSHVGEQVILQNNLQLNQCCLVNCWLNENVLNESQLVLNNNGEDCSTIETLKTTCIDNSACPKIKDGLFDLCIFENPPSNQSLTFSFISTVSKSIEYAVFNLNSQLLLKGGLTTEKGLNHKTVTLANQMPEGFYFLSINAGSRLQSAKFLKL